MDQHKENYGSSRLHLPHHFDVLVRTQVYELSAIYYQVQVESVCEVIEVVSELEVRRIELFHPGLDRICFGLLVPQFPLDILYFFLPGHFVDLAHGVNLSNVLFQFDIVVGKLPVLVVRVLADLLHPMRVNHGEQVERNVGEENLAQLRLEDGLPLVLIIKSQFNQECY